MISVYKRYIKRNFSLRTRAEVILNGIQVTAQWKSRYLAHALLSDIWQHWCSFCREVVICSCSGSITRIGSHIPARLSDNSWRRVAYEINQAKNGRAANPGREISFKRQEPTWGDQNTLLNAIPVLAPANSSTLLAGFGLPTYAPRHIQIIRNSSAHTNSETIAEVRSLLPYYIGSNFKHPLDVLWWNESNTHSPAIFFWLNELETIAFQVTE